MLKVPPLRERIEDVTALVEHFIGIFNERLQRKVPVATIDEEALKATEAYPWPGNVRELSNAIEGAFTFSHTPIIGLDDLPSAIAGSRPKRAPRTEAAAATLLPSVLLSVSFL